MSKTEILKKIASGDLVAKKPEKRRAKIFDDFKLLFGKNVKVVNDWYFCNRCQDVLNVPFTNGNKQLHKHIESGCKFMPNIPTITGEKLFYFYNFYRTYFFSFNRRYQ